MDETYVKVAGQWRYVYRAIDQFGQVIDVYVASRRDTKAARCFFERAIGTTKITPTEVTTIRPRCTRRCWRSCWRRPASHRPVRQQSGRVRPSEAEGAAGSVRGRNQDRSARVVIAGHAFVQNLRRGHYELAVEEPTGEGGRIDAMVLAI